MMEDCPLKLLENFDEYPTKRKRSEGRLKRYCSNDDIRSWSQNKHERQQYMQEFIAGLHSYAAITSSLPSAAPLVGALLAEKNFKILKLQALLDSYEKKIPLENISDDLTPSKPESVVLVPNTDGEKEKISVPQVEIIIPESGDVKKEEENQVVLVKISEPIDAKQKEEKHHESEGLEHTISTVTAKEQQLQCSPARISHQKKNLDVRESTDSVLIESLLQKQARKIETLEGENLKFKRLTLDLKDERESMRKQLKDLDGIANDVESFKEKIKNQILSRTDTEKLQYQGFAQDQILLKQLLQQNNEKRIFLEGHLSKLTCLLQAIITFEKDRERLASAVQENDALRREMNEWKQYALEVEEDLSTIDAMSGHSKDLENKIQTLERQLEDALRRENELKEEIMDNKKGMRDLKQNSIILEDNVFKDENENQRLMTEATEWETEREKLMRDRDNIAIKLEAMVMERDTLKTIINELQEKISAHEMEKQRLQKLMGEEELRSKSNLEEIEKWRKTSLDNERSAENYKEDIDKVMNEYQSQIGNLQESILIKDQELQNMNNEMSRLRDSVKSLEEKVESFEIEVKLLQKEKDDIKNDEMKRLEEEKSKWEQEHKKLTDVSMELEIDVEYSGEERFSDCMTSPVKKADWIKKPTKTNLPSVNREDPKLLQMEIFQTKIQQCNFLDGLTKASSITVGIWNSDGIHYHKK